MSSQPAVESRSDHSKEPNFRALWRLANTYEKFEQLVVFALSLIIAGIVLMALVQLCLSLVPLVIGDALNPLDHKVFQSVFGAIFTVLIAMEFKHSIVRAALRRDGMVQVRTVLLIALLAMSRKFVILDATNTSAGTIAALGAVTLVLGIVYWLLRDPDSRIARAG
ncbi:MAG: phosphate-starvation-inducible PsiE family protein [Panacagrimonas sp.]